MRYRKRVDPVEASSRRFFASERASKAALGSLGARLSAQSLRCTRRTDSPRVLLGELDASSLAESGSDDLGALGNGDGLGREVSNGRAVSPLASRILGDTTAESVKLRSRLLAIDAVELCAVRASAMFISSPRLMSNLMVLALSSRYLDAVGTESLAELLGGAVLSLRVLCESGAEGQL